MQADTRVATEELNPADNSDSDTNSLQPQPNLSIAKSDGLTQVVAGEPLSYAIDVANAGVSDALLADVADLAPIFPTSTAGFISAPSQWSCRANEPLAFMGSLTDVAETALTGVTAMALSPDGSQMFAVNPTSNALLVFARQPDGTLAAPVVIQNGTDLSGTTVDGLGGASNLATTGDGRHVLVTAATSNSLVVFSRDAGGVLRFAQKLTSGSGGVAGLLGATDVVVARDGRRVFVASPTSHAIAVFSRDLNSGVLSFVERVADGLGTIVPDSNVIRGVRRLHLSDDGLHLYAVATLSSALSRFTVNAATGKLTYAGVQRSVYAGLSALAGARDIVAAPGDTHLYALGSSGIVRFDRAFDGALTPGGSLASIPGLTTPRALSLDAFGSRLYLSDAGGGVHVIARDWSNGALDHRQLFSASGGALGASNELLHVPGSSDLYVSSATPGLIAQLDELALSRCLSAGAPQNAIATEVDLGATGTASLIFDLRVHPSARGVLSNTATVQAGSGVDPVASNNTSTDTTTIIVRSDTSITKTAPAQVVAGETISYRVVAQNTGPSNALGVQVQDLLNPALLNPTWTCVSSGASLCPASGSGSINVTTDLLVGDTLTFDITARVAPSFVGTLSNQATLVPEAAAIDPTPTDHVAQVQTNVIAVANASISKSNNLTQANAGGTITYQINVANAGPSDAPNVRVADPVPGLLLNPTWTCTGTGAATCPASGSGSPDFIASMPAGTSVQLVLEGTLPSAATGTLTNTATATVQGSAQDPDTANNSATDSDPIVFVPDVLLQIADPLDPFDPAGTIGLPYIVSITNGGPSDAHGIVLNLTTSVVASFALPPGCVMTGTVNVQCTIGNLISGRTTDLTFAFSGLPPGTMSFSLSGSVTTTDPDPDLANNVATQTTQLTTGANVRVTINDGRQVIPMGYLAVYRISVENIGSLPASGINVSSAIAPQLINATWTCSSPSGVPCSGPGTGAISDTISLTRGQSVVYTLQAIVDPGLDQSQAHTITQVASAMPAPGVDINLVDNSDEDVNDVTPVLFGDGFEDGLPLHGSPTLAQAAACTDIATWIIDCADFTQGAR